jgi:hypothetical protein
MQDTTHVMASTARLLIGRPTVLGIAMEHTAEQIQPNVSSSVGQSGEYGAQVVACAADVGIERRDQALLGLRGSTGQHSSAA